MKTTDFERFSKPIDTQARIVSSPQKPEYQYETPIKNHWKTPPPMIPWKARTREGNRVNIGDVYGRFTVVGAWGLIGNGERKRMRYVVRCSCGDYELRTAQDMRTNKNRAHNLNACFNCMRLNNLTSGA
jgi:hypothetical protein